MEVILDDLQEIFEVLLQNIREKGVESVFLDIDYYWNVPQDQIYDPYNKPDELDLGQLSDDWQELKRVIQAKKEPLGYHLVWLAAILRAIGEKITL